MISSLIDDQWEFYVSKNIFTEDKFW